MKNKKGKPVVTPEMQKFGREKLGIDLAKLNAIDDQSSVTGIVSHIETSEPSEDSQEQAHSSLGDTQEKSPTEGTETPTGGTQDTPGRTVQEPGKRPTEGAEMPLNGTVREGEGSGENERVASLGFHLAINQSESSTDGTQEQPDSSLREPLGTHTDDTQRPGGTVVQAAVETPTEGTETPEYDNCFGAGEHSFNDIVNWFRGRPKRRRFWRGFVIEHYVNCIFGRAGVGKSTICINIAEELALLFPDRKALWFDVENDAQLLEERSTLGDVQHFFPETCIREEPEDGEDVFEMMKTKIEQHNPVLVILDNLSAVCGKLEDGDLALEAAKKLKRLIRGRDCTMIVIAHTPKLSETQELEGSSLGGSHKLLDMFQNVIAVARCHDIPNAIYAKHVKCRVGGDVFEGRDVAILDRKEENGLLALRFRLNPDGSLMRSPEFPHLKKTRDQQQEDAKLEILKELAGEGKTTEEICKALDISRRGYFYLKKKARK